MLDILITGGNGFVGSHVARHLVQRGHRVRALVYPGTSTASLADVPVALYVGDITKPESLVEPMRGVSHVVHLAAKVADWGPEAAFSASIVAGSENVLRAAVAAGAIQFVHMSSLSVHRYSGHSHSDESAARDGNINAYARTKIAAEVLMERYRPQIATTIVRPGLMPYGPGDVLAFPQLVNALRTKRFRLVDGGRHRFGISYVVNLAHGIALCLEQHNARNETFVLADDDVLTWRQLADDLTDALEIPRIETSVPAWLARLGGAVCETCAEFGLLREPPLTRYRIATVSSDIVFSSNKAKRMLGYAPRVDWRTGLHETLRWYLRQNQV